MRRFSKRNLIPRALWFLFGIHPRLEGLSAFAGPRGPWANYRVVAMRLRWGNVWYTSPESEDSESGLARVIANDNPWYSWNREGIDALEG